MTGAGVVEVKKALDEAAGDETKVLEILKVKSKQKASKKAERAAMEGVVISYVHSNGKVGAMVKLYCETDFVARNEEFKALAQDIAMHVTAMNPQYVNPEDVPQEVVDEEKKVWAEQLKNEGKPENMLEKIMAGKEKKFREEVALMSQPFVKNPEQTVAELITEKISKTGENIRVGEFVRFEL